MTEFQPFTFFADNDNDSFGDADVSLDTCLATVPTGFVTDSTDCNDNNSAIYPGAMEIPDNGIDEDCDGMDMPTSTKNIAFDKGIKNIPKSIYP